VSGGGPSWEVIGERGATGMGAREATGAIRGGVEGRGVLEEGEEE
jgi:hypothetical protein